MTVIIYIYIYIYIYMHKYMHICVRARVRARARACVCVCVCVHVLRIYAYVSVQCFLWINSEEEKDSFKNQIWNCARCSLVSEGLWLFFYQKWIWNKNDFYSAGSNQLAKHIKSIFKRCLFLSKSVGFYLEFINK